MSKAVEILKNHKLRVTDNRLGLVQLFLNTDVALSSSDIERSLPKIDRVTLYRTIKSFQEKGVIHKAIDGTDTARYAMCVDNCAEHDHKDDHVHFRCNKCNNTFCLDHTTTPEITIPQGFTVTSSNLVITGICDKCN